MSDKTGIQWTEATWNPLRGCSKKSPGCAHCYAANMAARFSGPGQPYEGLAYFDATKQGQWTGKIRFIDEKVEDPVRWRRPRMVFVNSMSDLFHPDVPFDFVYRVWASMAVASQHTFQVLTKRPERMHAFLASPSFEDDLAGAVRDLLTRHPKKEWPFQGSVPPRALPNVWVGASVESQPYVSRVDALRKVPAAVRFLSCEPLLGALDLNLEGIHWVIVGGESQDGAREMDAEWPRGIRDQCRAAGVAYFMKQMGGAHNKRGRLEDLPGDLRIREFPEVVA